MLPGIESWYDYGNKSKTTRTSGLDKVGQVAEQINRILSYIPFVQANFILGLDCDAGDEPYALTKRFIDLTPGAYHAFSLFTCYGRASPNWSAARRPGQCDGVHFLEKYGMKISRSIIPGRISTTAWPTHPPRSAQGSLARLAPTGRAPRAAHTGSGA